MTQRTLAIIKPDAVHRGVAGAILSKVGRRASRCSRQALRMSFTTRPGFYAVHRQRPFFKSLCTS